MSLVGDHDIIVIGPRRDRGAHVLMVWCDGQICSVVLVWQPAARVWLTGHARVVGELVGHEKCIRDVLDLSITVEGVGPLGPDARQWWRRQSNLTDLKLQRIRVAKAVIDGREVARICHGAVADAVAEPQPSRKEVG